MELVLEIILARTVRIEGGARGGLLDSRPICSRPSTHWCRAITKRPNEPHVFETEGCSISISAVQRRSVALKQRARVDADVLKDG